MVRFGGLYTLIQMGVLRRGAYVVVITDRDIGSTHYLPNANVNR